MTTRGKLLSQGGGTGYTQFPSDLGGPLSRHYVLFKVFTNTGDGLKVDFPEGAGGPESNNTTIARPVSESPKDFIALYMPAQIANNTSAKYSEVALGNTLAAYQGLTGEASAMDAAKNYLKGFADNLGAEAAAAVAIQEIQGGEVANNRMEMVFETIDRRTFQFDFRMMPKSAAESNAIKSIVKTFRTNMAPRTSGAGNLRFRVPSLFEIEFKPNDANALPKIGKSVCTACNVTYGGARAQFFADGNPVETSISLTFQELDLPTAQRVEDGY